MRIRELLLHATSEEDCVNAAWAIVDAALYTLNIEQDQQISPERKIEVVEALCTDPSLCEHVFELNFWLRN